MRTKGCALLGIQSRIQGSALPILTWAAGLPPTGGRGWEAGLCRSLCSQGGCPSSEPCLLSQWVVLQLCGLASAWLLGTLSILSYNSIQHCVSPGVSADTHSESPCRCLLVASPRVSPVSASHPPVIFWVKVLIPEWSPGSPYGCRKWGAGAEVLELEWPWHSSQGPGPSVHTSAQQCTSTKEASLGLRQ